MKQFFLEIYISFRYLRSKHKSGFISITSSFAMLGIILGVATLIVVMSVMNGYREELTRITLGVSGHITVKSTSNGIVDYHQYLNDLKKMPEVKEITPLIEQQVMVTTNSKASGSLIRGIENGDLKRKNIITNNLVDGSLSAYLHDDNAVMVGEGLAGNLGLNVGDDIKVVTSGLTKTVMGSIPRFKTMTVAAIFRSGSYMFDSALLFMHMESAQRLFSMPNMISQIEVNIHDPFQSTMLTKDVANLLKRKFYVEDWQYQNAQILSALEIERAVMFLILTLIVVVAAFNIISSLYMLVNDKKYDIAILRTIGASRFTIVRIFVYMGFILGAFGVLSGVALGIGFVKNINTIKDFLESITSVSLFDPVVYYLNNLPAKIDYNDVRRIIFITLGLSIISTLFPAFKASQVNPGEALRND
ncbi:MAG: lipoprotein-releasing ABC transporter permease subunit [Alphaproteobacteria bacterium]|nr:lipoprotein-releasing ABC transporter permease subunit [Alphaproteobacteria bacterium]OJV14041.1 MAG: hypothetical protein BGO27_00940 [Alphaproteobacteria bacterium 33-17]